jgi:hypothetical protein
MSEVTAAERRVETLVRVRTRQPGGPWFVELVGVSDEPVSLGPYDNPSVARDDARKIRNYLAALLGGRGQ